MFVVAVVLLAFAAAIAWLVDADQVDPIEMPF